MRQSPFERATVLEGGAAIDGPPEAMMSLAAMSNVSFARRAVVGFIAGFVTVLTFFQLALFLLYLIGAIANPPPNLAPTAPFGVPNLLSGAFFGGLWGILFALVEPRFPRGPAYWVAAILFGAIVLDLGLWFVVAPLKGYSVGFGFAPHDVLIALFLHSVWGLGMAILYKLARGALPG
jgi:hypothetical protein